MGVIRRFLLTIIAVFISISFAVGEIDILEIDEKDRDTFVEYTANFNFNNMHCIFRINGLLFTTSTLILPEGWKLENMQFSDDIGGMLQPGNNSLEIEGIQVPTPPKAGTVSYCEMSIYASGINRKTGETGGKEVSHLRLSINEEGKFTAEQSRIFPEPSVTDELQLIELEKKTIKREELNNNVLIKRNLQINHRHDSFAWTRAKPFENTPENVERLWNTYEEIIGLFARGNLDKIEQFLLPAGTERDHYTGYDGQGSRRVAEMMLAIERSMGKNGFIPAKINRDDYELQIANHGKLFRLNYKGGFMASPIEFQAERDESNLYNFYFTEIDGKIRIGVL